MDNDRQQFGPASACQSLAELRTLAKRAIVAYGMILTARSVPVGDHHENALEVLDSLGKAKMELDASVCHAEPTVIVTASILSATQKFVDEMTIPCTEWPTSTEVVSFVSEIAARYAHTGPWRRTLLGSHGEVIGAGEFDTPRSRESRRRCLQRGESTFSCFSPAVNQGGTFRGVLP